MSRQVRKFRSREELRKLAQVEEGTLPTLPVTNDGNVYRWIRVALRGEDDIQNISRRQREGWTFVKPDEMPKEFKGLPVREYGKMEGVVGIDDVALARLPREIAEARQELVELNAAEMMQAVNADLMRNNDTRMPISNESKSTVRRGRNAQFDA